MACVFLVGLLYLAVSHALMTTESPSTEFPGFPALSSFFKSNSHLKVTEVLQKLGESLVDGSASSASVQDIRRKLREKLFQHVEELKAKHGLPSALSEDRARRGKRDTIQADVLTSSVAARRRRSYSGQPGEFQIDSGMNHVMKRIFRLQEPNFQSSNVTDINYVIEGGQRYLVVLEHTGSGAKTIIYRISKNWMLEELGIIDTPDAVMCEIFEIDGYVYLLPITLLPINQETLEGGSGLYRLSLKSSTMKAIKVQTIDTHNAKSVLFWTSYGIDANDGLLCVAPEVEVTSRGPKYHVQVSCYRWQGGYFDLNFHLPADSPQAMDHIRINSHNYLCVANYKDDTGSTAIQSIIYRYNHKKGKYLPFQRIRTNGARDCKFFKFDTAENGKEHYLAIANYGHEDENGEVNHNAKSFIFKFAYGRFVFFQSLVTVGAFQLLPIQYGETFVLVVAEMHRLSVFQHNGWSFVKTRQMDFPEENLVNQFRMRPALHSNQSFFTVASPKLPAHTGIHAIEFEAKNDYTTVTSDFEQWCNHAFENVQSVNLPELVAEASSVPNTTSKQVVLSGPVTFKSGLQTTIISTEALTYENAEFDAERAMYLSEAENQLQSLYHEKEDLKERLSNVVHLDAGQEVLTRVKFLEWQVSNTSTLETSKMTTTSINGINVEDILNRAIFLDQNYDNLGRVNVSSIKSEYPVHTDEINGVSLDELLLKNSSEVQKLVNSNKFMSRVIATSGFNVTEHLNGLNVSNIVTYKGDQHFADIIISNSTVSNLNASVINGIEIRKVVEQSVPKNGTQIVNGKKTFANVQTDRIQAVGLISGYNVTHIYETAVFTSNISTYTFTAKPVFNDMRLSSLNVADEQINGGYRLQDFVSSQSGNYSGGKWIMHNSTKAREMFVTGSLNGIPVKSGKLKVLLKNSTDYQVVVGHNLDAIYLKGPGELNSTVNGIAFTDWNTTETIQLDNPNIPGMIYAVNASFPKGVKVQTFTQESHNVLDVLGKLIPTSKPFPCNPSFVRFESIRVDGNSQIEKVNGLSPVEDWLDNNNTQRVSINAPKNFFGDIFISESSTTGPLYASAARDTDIMSVLRTALLNGTDQEITGNIKFTDFLRLLNLSAPSDQEVTLDGIRLSDILTTKSNQFVHVKSTLRSKTIVNNSFTVLNDMSAYKINGINILEVWNDTLKKQSLDAQRVTGNYTFSAGLFVSNVQLDGKLGQFTVNDLLQAIVLNGHNDTFMFDSPSRIRGTLTFNSTANIAAVNFADSINQIKADHWGNLWMTRKGRQEIYTPFYFTSLKVQQPHVPSGFVSGINVQELNQTTLLNHGGGSIQGAHFLSDVFFNGDFCSPSLNGYNLASDFLRKSTKTPQVVTGLKEFLSNWTVHGNLNAVKIEQVDWVNLVRFTDGQIAAAENLYIHGNCTVRFEPEPPETVNLLSWDEIIGSLWLSDRPTNITGPISFESLHMVGGSVNGLIDGVDVIKLQKEYLSRTKNQVSNGSYTFQNKFCVASITSDSAIIQNGTLNGVNVRELSASVLKYGVSQTIATELHTGSLSVPNFTISAGTLNGFNFCHDFVSIQGKNRVKSLKNIRLADVQTLTLPSNVEVNGVKLYSWLKNAVLTNGSFTINDNPALVKASFKDVTVEGMVNEKIVNEDTVMRTSGNQVGNSSLTLTGEQTTRFTNIHLVGTLNGLKIDDFFGNTVVKNISDPIYINGSVIMEAPVAAAWVQTEDRYDQHDVDITQFLNNYQVANYVNGTDHRSLREKYQEIVSVTERLLHIATEHAVLAKCVQETPGISLQRTIIAKPALDDGEPILAVVQNENEYQSIQLWSLDSEISSYKRIPTDKVKIYGSVRDIVRVRGTSDLVLLAVVVSVSREPVKYETDGVTRSSEVQDKRAVALLITRSSGANTSSELAIQQVLHADDLTHAAAFKVKTSNGTRICLLTGAFSGSQYGLLLQCTKTRPSVQIRFEFEQLQRISLEKVPEITSLTVGDKTMIILSDSNSSTSRVPQSDYVKVYTFNANASRLAEEDCFPVMNVISVDCILAPNYHPFLAVVSGRMRKTRHEGSIYIYRYSEESGRFTKFQTILVENPVTARFQRLEPSDELVLYVLTQNLVNNVHVYSFKGVSGWTREHSFTAERAQSLETVHFFHRGDYVARLLAVGPDGVQSFDWAFNGITYVYGRLQE